MSEEQPLVAGRYRLVELIGRGGMGDVYRGDDIETGEPVAIKLLHQAIVEENPDIVDRFRREGEALRQLNHPNIVQILDTLEENGQHYLVMEYVGGGSLRDLMDDQTRLPTEAVLNIALDLADALTRAHRLNIIHRDIKPDNVLLAEDGTPRLTDFGVAHLGNRTRLTQTGSVIGTYAYLSPEACNGLELDARTDIWSFGVMLYEMLAGRLPFLETGTAAILTAILTKPAPDLARLRPGLPSALYDLIYRMLEKDRDRRLSSVRLVGAELEALIRNMDTPLRSLVLGAAPTPSGSRFATPSEQGDVPAMDRSEDQLTHGFSVYPGQPPVTPPEGMPPSAMFTPGTGEMVPVRTNKWQWIALMVIVTVLACSVVAVIALIIGPRGDEESPPGDQGQPAIVEPVGPDEYMVLVAQLEPLSDARRNVSRFIADDLEQKLEVDVPFSKARIRQYPAIITSEEGALAAAEANNATVIIWGNYTAELVEVEVQVGVISAFEDMALDRARVEQAANVRVRLTDERAESIAPEVLGVLGVLQGSEGDVYEYMRTVAVLAEIDTQGGQIAGDNVAAHVHEYFQTFHHDTPAAITHIDHAIDKDATNPFTYALRSIALQKEGRLDEAKRAAETALRLAPETWVVPYYLLALAADTPDEALSYYDRIVELRPDDWYAYSTRGAYYYLMGDAEHTRADLDKAIELKPNANYPYALAALLAIAQGRIEDAVNLTMTILQDFPDPDLYSRIVGATVGGQDNFGPIVSAYVNLSLGRYEKTLESTATGLERLGPSPDLLTMRALAFCNLEDYANAEDTYSQVLDLIPPEASGFTHLLRGDVRLEQKNNDGALADFTAAAQYGMPPELVDSFASGKLNCENYFGAAEQVPAGAVVPEPSAGPLAAPDSVISLVEPVEPGEYMVLVADLEALGGIGQLAAGRQPDASRFVADDLEDLLEKTVPFSNIRVRRYPGIITSDEAARAAAEANNATVIVWGNYTPDLVELEVQVGALTDFPYNLFDRATLERTGNVRVRLSDARRESVAPYVLGVLSTLQSADGDAYETMRLMAILDAIDVTSAEVVGTSVAAQVHRYFAAALDSPDQAIQFVDAALSLDAGDPILYTLRSTVNQRRGLIDAARRDAQTAQRLGPSGWTMPDLLLASVTRDDSVIDLFTRVIERRPDDWFPLFFRGAIYYDLIDSLPDANRLAYADLEAAVALEPNANFPYIYSALLALREARFADAGAAIQVVLAEFPDPSFMARLINATFGEGALNPYSLTLSAFANETLGRHVEVINQTSAGLIDFPEMVDLHMMQGISYCSIGDPRTAEASFSRAITFAPDYTLLYLLRAGANAALDNSDDMETDLAVVEASDQARAFEPFVDAMRAGDLDCANFLSPDNALLFTAADTTPTPAAAGPAAPVELVVLVAQIEPLNGVAERDVARFIVDNLQRELVDELPNSVFRIETLPVIITSDEDAQANARATGATVSIWGNYTSDLIELEVQLGITDAFPYIQFERATLEKLANVRVRLSNERQETVAQQVVNITNLLTIADGNEFGFFLSLAVLDSLHTTSGTVVGSSPAAHWHRALAAFTTLTRHAVLELNETIRLDSGNPILYIYRALANLRLNNLDEPPTDIETARRLGPPDWTAPIYLGMVFESDPNAALQTFTRLIDLRPTDWYPVYGRGLFNYYFVGDLTAARADFARSIELEPFDKLPYFFSMMIALREGRIDDAQSLMQTIIHRFPDPEVTNRAMQALYGDKVDQNFTGVLIAAGTNLLLGQYSSVLGVIGDSLDPLLDDPGLLQQEAITAGDRLALSDLLLIGGLAVCNLGDYENADAAYSLAIEADPDYALLYLLRAQVREVLGESTAQEDFDAAQAHDLGAAFDPWVEAGRAGTWTCTNFFDYQPVE